MIFNFHFSKGGPFLFRGGLSATPRGWTVKNRFQSVFLGPYGIPHPYKYPAKKYLHFSFLATAKVGPTGWLYSFLRLAPPTEYLDSRFRYKADIKADIAIVERFVQKT